MPFAPQRYNNTIGRRKAHKKTYDDNIVTLIATSLAGPVPSVASKAKPAAVHLQVTIVRRVSEVN